MRVLCVPAVLAAVALSGCSYDIATPDCETVLTPTEAAVCASPKLRKLDRDLRKRYRVALSISGDDEPHLRSEQNAWIAERNTCLDNETCIAELYRERINVLADYD